MGTMSEVQYWQQVKMFFAWYKQLRKKYGIFTSINSALYNYKYYDLDGNYNDDVKRRMGISLH